MPLFLSSSISFSLALTLSFLNVLFVYFFISLYFILFLNIFAILPMRAPFVTSTKCTLQLHSKEHNDTFHEYNPYFDMLSTVNLNQCFVLCTFAYYKHNQHKIRSMHR